MPTEQFFTHGYALLIAVNDNLIPNYALPAVARDAAALREVLVSPDRCAYHPDNVRVIQGPDASRAGIQDGIAWLKRKLSTDGNENTTALLYYTGHGAFDQQNQSYYLLPYDLRQPLADSLMRAEDVAAEIETVRPQRMLVILDCCHAGGMGIKGEDLLEESGLDKTAAPPLAKNVVTLMQGQGRAVLSSSSASESSYVRADRSMSIFTYHLVEALSGHAHTDDATEVLVSDVMGYVSRAVPRSARQSYDVAQTPVYQMNGENFPVALLIGGKGIGKGQAPPDPLSNGNSPFGGPTINTNGGTYIRGHVSVGSDFTGRDQHIHGDSIKGNQYVLSGQFAGAVLNIESQLTDVTQSILASRTGDASGRAELNTLVADLQQELEQLPADRAKEADIVVGRLRRATTALESGDDELVDINSDALVRASYGLGDIRPGIPAVARQISAALSRLVI
ncbi:MAG: caspase family protein [Chloroflexota bacterium]|jgi:hypothetical protein